MTYLEFVKRTITAIVIFLVGVFGAIIMWNLRSILLIGFTCWVFSVALNVPITKLQKQGLQRTYAIILTFIGVGLGFALIVTLILPPFVREFGNLVEDAPAAAEQAVIEYDQFYQDTEPIQRFLPKFTLADYQELTEPKTEDLTQGEEEQAAFNLTGVATSALPILGGVGSLVGTILGNLFIIVVITVYLVLDPITYYRGIIAMVPKESEQRAIEILNEIKRIINAWLGALVISFTVNAVMVTVVLGVFLQVPNALALGMIAGLGSLIPYLGFYASLLPIIIFTAADDPVKLTLVIPIYIALGEFESKIITPRVIQSELNLPAAIVLIFQLIAAAYLGFFGILLAVPLVAILVALVRELHVYDNLGKKGQVPEIIEGADGRLALKYQNLPPEEATI